MNSRMTVAIHVLAFMVSAESHGRAPVTSERIASSVNTNPVVIRRILGLLRKAGLVHSHRGPRAGWTLARRPEAITLLDVHRAVEDGALFAMHPSPPNQRCPIGRGIQPALRRVYGSLQEQLEDELSRTTIDQVLADVVG